MSSSPPPHGAIGVKPLLNMKSIHRAPGQALAIKAGASRSHNYGCSKGLQPDLTTGSLAPRQDRPPCRPRRRVPRFMGPGCANANGGLTETWSAAGSGVPVEQRRIADHNRTADVAHSWVDRGLDRNFRADVSHVRGSDCNPRCVRIKFDPQHDFCYGLGRGARQTQRERSEGRADVHC